MFCNASRIRDSQALAGCFKLLLGHFSRGYYWPMQMALQPNLPVKLDGIAKVVREL
jgi:hypothetical protein